MRKMYETKDDFNRKCSHASLTRLKYVTVLFLVKMWQEVTFFDSAIGRCSKFPKRPPIWEKVNPDKNVENSAKTFPCQSCVEGKTKSGISMKNFAGVNFCRGRLNFTILRPSWRRQKRAETSTEMHQTNLKMKNKSM